MKRTLFLLGPSDLEAQNAFSRESVDHGTRVDLSLAGVLPLLPFISEDKMLNSNSQSAVIGLHQIQRPAGLDFNVFNLVGDADSSPFMLKRVQSVIDQLRPSRCFNRPENVLRTGRAQLPETLDGIPGCLVPEVMPAQPRDLAELKELCRTFGRWPLIIRSPGEHGGKQMLLLDDIDRLEEHRTLSWLYEGICLMEFHDYRGDDGLYQKNRVVVVDGVPYPRHALFSHHWMIHAGTRSELMVDDMELVHRERQFVSTQVQQYFPVFEEMYRRIGLDIFGVDFAIVDGKVLVFEANACMKFLDRKHRADNRFAYLDERVRKLKHAIKKMLVRA